MIPSISCPASIVPISFIRCADTIVFAEFASAALTLITLYAIVRFDLQGRRVHPTLVFVALVAIADSMVQLYQSHAGWDTTNLAHRDRGDRHCLALGTCYHDPVRGGLDRLAGLRSFLYPNGEWIHYGFFLAWFTGIAIAVQAARTKLLRRLFESESHRRRSWSGWFRSGPGNWPTRASSCGIPSDWPG